MEQSKKKKIRLAETAKKDREIREAQEKEMQALSKAKGDAENKAATKKNKADASIKTVEPTMDGRLVRIDNVVNMESQGWNKVAPQPNKNVLDVRGTSDLVLMEKKL